MDSRSIVFLEVMIGIAAACLLAFLISLVVRSTVGSRDGTGENPAPIRTPKGYEFFLPVLLVLAIAAIVIWQLAPIDGQSPPATDWRSGSRSTIFFIVMLVVGGLGLLAFLVFLFTKVPRQPMAENPAPDTAAAEADQGQAATGARLLGLLLLAVGFLLLNWIYVPQGEQYALMLNLVYPASLGVALVLLFDKATRTWSTKSTAEAVREWILCDSIVLLLILGFLNLLQSQAGAKYVALFWDFIAILLFFAVFWLIDRASTRYRFLVAYGYLAVLPILLVIWRAVQKSPSPEGLSWWGTVWPFFFLVIIFFVFEIFALVASRDPGKHTLPAIKDVLFVILSSVLLISALPGAPE